VKASKSSRWDPISLADLLLSSCHSAVLSGITTGAEELGKSEPQLHISKEGAPYLRTMMVQSAHYILGPFGSDSDLHAAMEGNDSGLR